MTSTKAAVLQQGDPNPVEREIYDQPQREPRAEFFFSGSLKWRCIIFIHVSTTYMLHHNSPIHGRKGESERVRVYVPIARFCFVYKRARPRWRWWGAERKEARKATKRRREREREKHEITAAAPVRSRARAGNNNNNGTLETSCGETASTFADQNKDLVTSPAASSVEPL